jgi:exosortase family protein XrtF
MRWKEFKPTVFFLGKFLTIYLAGNLVYGFFVVSYNPSPDPITNWVTSQTATCLSVLGWPAKHVERTNRPTTAIYYQDKSIVTVYEGCNGVNVMIIFVAFLVAFGPWRKELLWFIPWGILVIHISNLLRIGLLFFVTLYWSNYLYLSHKYLFTAFIYGFVLLLWMLWVKRFSAHDKTRAT